MNSQTTSTYEKTSYITTTAMMAALVFVGTYFFKIPTFFGYTHLGDCMIILAVCLFGTRQGALAGAIGAGLSDLLGGYAIWAIPTIAFKSLWAIIMGFITYRLLPNTKYNWLIGAIVGGIVHITCYTLMKIPLFGLEYAVSRIPVITGQTILGIIFGGILYGFFKHSSTLIKFASK